MSHDADRKRALLAGWWSDLLPLYSARLLDAGEPLDAGAALRRLAVLRRAGPCVYVLLSEREGGRVPVYVGKADDALARWEQHLAGWLAGRGPYARWRRALLDEGGRARHGLDLLVVPASAVASPPIPGFPMTPGSVEYQLVGLAADAYPGALLNREGKGR